MNKIKMKNKLGLFFVLFAALIAVFSVCTSSVLADEFSPTAPVDIKEMSVYVKGDLVWYGYCSEQKGWGYWFRGNFHAPDTWVQVVPDGWKCVTQQYATPAIDRGETVPVRISFVSNVDLEEVTAKTWMNGYREEIEDQTGKFDIFAGNTYSKTLYLDIPSDADARELYSLYVEILDNVALSGVARAVIQWNVQQQSNLLEIKDVQLYAGQNVCSCTTEQIAKGQCGECFISFVPGSVLNADVVLKNRGSQAQEDVFVKLSIKELCFERTVYVGDLASNESEKVTVSFVLPENTKEGRYSLAIDAFNDDVKTSVERSFSVITKGAEKNVKVLFEQTRNDVEQGESAEYSLYVANLGDSSETFMVSLEGTKGWAVAQTNPAVFSLNAGESKMVRIQLTASEDALATEHQFTVKVNYGSEVESYVLGANVTEKAGFDWKALVLIAGIILAVAIIVLLIFLLVNKNGKSQVEKPEEYSYY